MTAKTPPCSGRSKHMLLTKPPFLKQNIFLPYLCFEGKYPRQEDLKIDGVGRRVTPQIGLGTILENGFSSLHLLLIPKVLSAGSHSLSFIYYSPQRTFYSPEAFIDSIFYEDENVQPSKMNVTNPPLVANAEGAEVQFMVWNGHPISPVSRIFSSSTLNQADDCYIRCIKKQKVDSVYYLSFEVRVKIPSALETTDYKPLVRTVEGVFTYRIDI
jgi:hypothetical protein